jgi:hypothetical protein
VNPRRTWTVLLACSAAALLIAAPISSAKPGYFVIPAYQSIDLNLEGSKGYWINIAKQGRYVNLLAASRDTAVTYAARSLVPKGSEIRARFPGVGRVFVRFQPQGPPREEKPFPLRGCKGGEIVKQPGQWVGTIRFRGEKGYTSASATRVRAAREIRAKAVCKRPRVSPQLEEDRTELYAISGSRKRAVAFDASKVVIPDLGATTSFGASVAEIRRGMTIIRHLFVSGKAKDVVAGDTRPHPLSGTFAPPAPFRGSGEFQRDAEGNSTWTGSLTVPFPGLDPVALTGPEFTARFCQHSGCTGGLIDGHSLPLIASTHERLRLP